MSSSSNSATHILSTRGAALMVLCCALSACELLLFDNRTITTGKLEAFRIGESKAEVLAGIRRMPAVAGIHAIPPFDITSDQTERLGKILMAISWRSILGATNVIQRKCASSSLMACRKWP